MKLIHPVAAVLITAGSPAFALDQTDVGSYAVIHVDGHVTEMMFRVTHPQGGWKVESRKADGSWEEVTCEAECAMVESSAAEVERFLGKVPTGMAADCIHNASFAICRVTDQAGLKERQYLFVALTERQPIALRLARQDK